jgi:beta-glucosidase
MTEVRESARPAPPHQLSPHEADDARVPDLLRRIDVGEKLAQIVGFWEKADGEAVAPLQGEFGAISSLGDFTRHGLGTSPGRTGPARSTPPSGRRGCGRSSATS